MRREMEDFKGLNIGQRHEDSTKKAYKSSAASWYDYCDDTGIHWMEWNPSTVADYVAFRRLYHKVKGKTIAANLSGIRAALINRGMEYVMEYNEYTMVQAHCLLAAIRKMDAEHRKLPLTVKELRRMFLLLSPQKHDCRVLRAIMAVMHNSLRRANEMFPVITEGITPRDITWSGGDHEPRLEPPLDTMASYNFYKSKTNKTGEDQSALLWCRCPEGGICGLCELRRLYAGYNGNGRRMSEDSVLFTLDSGRVVDYEVLLKVVKLLAEKIGLDPKLYGTHSLRRGGLWDMLDLKYEDKLINAQAFWKNNRSRRPYERTSIEAVNLEKMKSLSLTMEKRGDLVSKRGIDKLLNKGSRGRKAGRARKKKRQQMQLSLVGKQQKPRKESRNKPRMQAKDSRKKPTVSTRCDHEENEEEAKGMEEDMNEEEDSEDDDMMMRKEGVTTKDGLYAFAATLSPMMVTQRRMTAEEEQREKLQQEQWRRETERGRAAKRRLQREADIEQEDDRMQRGRSRRSRRASSRNKERVDYSKFF